MQAVSITFLACALAAAASAEVAQWGGSPARNNVIAAAAAKDVPIDWAIGAFDFETGAWQSEKSRHIRWVARLGSNAFGNPAVADGKVFVGTNNDAGYLPRFPKGKVDLGVLLCFSEADGGFLWQYSAAKLASGDKHDYAATGICSSPLVEGDRVYLVTNRCEVVCLDAEGFHDGENDGIKDEEHEGRDEADVIWRFDMMKTLGVEPVFMSATSVTSFEGVLYVHTGNSADEHAKRVPNPKAPSFIALRQATGELLWQDASPGGNILHGSWSSPAIDVAHRQVIFAGGDAWLYAFEIPAGFGSDRQSGAGGEGPTLKPAWRFDCNRKSAVWKERGQGDRTSVIATPVLHEDRLYIATGQITEHAEEPAALLCIDLAKARKGGGDVSEEWVTNAQWKGGREPVPPRRTFAADAAAGDVIKPNPRSALAWRYTGRDQSGDGKLEYAETFHRSISSAAVSGGFVIAVDFVGIVHCVDAATGKAHWTHDMLAGSWSTPLIAGDRAYIANDTGQVVVFALAKEKRVLAENDMGQTVYATPIVAGGAMYVMTKSRLFSIRKAE